MGIWTSRRCGLILIGSVLLIAWRCTVAELRRGADIMQRASTLCDALVAESLVLKGW